PHVGEVTVGPYDRLDRLFSAMDHCYPHKVDESCGMHVHTSFPKEDMVRLFTPAFFRHFKEFWTAWGKRARVRGQFWERLAGRNNYCQWPDTPEQSWHAGHYALL